MNFASPFAHVEALNALQELNAFFETSQDSNIRRTFYELDDIGNSHPTAEETYSIEDTDPEDDEICQLRVQIENGRKLLEDRILKYHEAKSALDQAKQLHDIDQRRLKLIHSSFLTLESERFAGALEAFETAKEQVEKQHADKIAELKKACDICTTDLQRMRSVFKILKTSESTFACPICLKTQVECFMNPCGHTYCNACVQHAEDKCFICRKSYSRIHNLFFS
jgi:hypothetical protein